MRRDGKDRDEKRQAPGRVMAQTVAETDVTERDRQRRRERERKRERERERRGR